MADHRSAIEAAKPGDRPMPDAPRRLNDRTAARARARAAWSDLGDRLASATPATLGRAVLVTAVIAGSVAVVVGTWPALLPFAIGGLIAYTVLPLVDALDGFMPRGLAAAVALLAVLAVVVGIFVVVVPPLATAVVALSTIVPSPDEIDQTVDVAVGQLPGSVREVAGPVLVAVISTVENGLASASSGLDDLGPTIVNAVVNVAGAALGLIVLPAWLLTVADRPSGEARGRGRSRASPAGFGPISGPSFACSTGPPGPTCAVSSSSPSSSAR